MAVLHGLVERLQASGQDLSLRAVAVRISVHSLLVGANARLQSRVERRQGPDVPDCVPVVDEL